MKLKIDLNLYLKVKCKINKNYKKYQMTCQLVLKKSKVCKIEKKILKIINSNSYQKKFLKIKKKVNYK